jgi:hypothetical protein
MGAPNVAELAMFSDDGYGPVSAGSLQPTYQDVLSWVLIWKGVPCSPAGAPPRVGYPPPTAGSTACDHVVFVNATTGHYLLALDHGT